MKILLWVILIIFLIGLLSGNRRIQDDFLIPLPGSAPGNPFDTSLRTSDWDHLQYPQTSRMDLLK